MSCASPDILLKAHEPPACHALFSVTAEDAALVVKALSGPGGCNVKRFDIPAKCFHLHASGPADELSACIAPVIHHNPQGN